MLTLPDAIVAARVPCATLFSNPTWRKAQVLLVGAILVPGQRTVAAALRVMGRSDDGDYARYHKVASVARMRKLLVILNAMVKHRSPWGDMSSNFRSFPLDIKDSCSRYTISPPHDQSAAMVADAAPRVAQCSCKSGRPDDTVNFCCWTEVSVD